MHTDKKSPEKSQEQLHETPTPESTGSGSSFADKLRHDKRLFFGLIGGIVAILLVFGFIHTFTKQKPNTTSKASTTKTEPKAEDPLADNVFMGQYGANCKERDVKFTSAPMQMDQLSYIRPLGAVSDSHVTPTDHVYIGGNPATKDSNAYAVLMPADGTVTSVAAMPSQYIGDRNEQKTATEDHNIWISHSCRYFSNYIHIHRLSDKLKAAAGTLEPGAQGKQVNMELKAGEVIGYVGAETFDWIPIDTTVRLKGIISPSQYNNAEPWKPHVVSPFDLYTGTLKTELEAKSIRSAAPVGGRIDYDQPGKLIGVWFREGSGGYSGNDQSRYWDGHLAIVPDYLDPKFTVVSFGNWTDNKAKQMSVSVGEDPAKVTTSSGAVKYELRNLMYAGTNPMDRYGYMAKGQYPDKTAPLAGTLLVEVLPGEKLKVEKFPGKAPADVSGFTDAAQTYER
jgi:hypothetical protein